MSRKPNELATIMAVIARYQSAGYEVFPLHGKKPVYRGWRERDYSDFDPARWLEQGENIGIRLRADDLIIDCDPRNYQPGDDPLRRLTEAVSAPLRDAPATITGSGGLHLFFRKPPDLRIVGKLTGYDGLDILTRANSSSRPARSTRRRSSITRRKAISGRFGWRRITCWSCWRDQGGPKGGPSPGS